MNVTIKQIRCFIAIAKLQSFAEAAEQVHLSQPALSVAMKNLEQTIGGKLFTRSTRSLALTPEGETFLPIAQGLLSNWDSALNDLSDRFNLKTGKLIIAAMPSFASTELPLQLKNFRDLYPNIDIKIHDVLAEQAVTMVRNGQVELALSFDPGHLEDLIFEPLFNDNFIAAVPQNHMLANQTTINWQQLSNQPFIALQHPSSIRHLIEKSLQAQGLSLSIEFETNQLATIGQMVAMGLGVSAMPSLCKAQLIAQGAVCKTLTSPTVSRRVGIIYRRRYPLSSTAQAFNELLRSAIKAD